MKPGSLYRSRWKLTFVSCKTNERSVKVYPDDIVLLVKEPNQRDGRNPSFIFLSPRNYGELFRLYDFDIKEYFELVKL